MKIVWSDPAVDDLTSIRDYIARDSERYATQFLSSIIAAVERLETLPQLGRRVPEAAGMSGVRELLFQSYRIIYRSEDNRVLILAVLHGSRDLSRSDFKPWEFS